jgi:lipopolysaccharide/colanic/teichoic acid biosynthesis glycosyltransferase
VQRLRENGQRLEKMDGDYALVPLGRWLRATALDELPQLINVLQGEMSLVGPRPDVLALDEYEPWQRLRFHAAPGMTGLWQVSGKNRTTFDEMVLLDLAYIRRRSPLLDAIILLRTPAALLAQAWAVWAERKPAPHPAAPLTTETEAA